MNNSKIAVENSALEPERDIKPLLRQREGELVKIIEALLGVGATEDWKTLRAMIFDGAVGSLERRLQTEARAKEVSLPELYRLQGELNGAKKYADLEKLAQAFKVELDNTRKRLNAENN